MNYIKRLEKENREMREALIDQDYRLRELISYLNSPKFFEDTTVQVKDVLNWVAYVREVIWPAQENRM